MPRKHDVDKINLRIDKINLIQWGDTPYGHIKIKWGSDIGFGEYTLHIKDDGSIVGDAETMDSNEDKAFIKKLMQLLVEKIKI